MLTNKPNLLFSAIVFLCLNLNAFASLVEFGDTIIPHYPPVHWEYDTILITGNCSAGFVYLYPGTRIIFTGDYTLSMSWMATWETLTDSLYISGYMSDSYSEPQGSIINYEHSPQNKYPQPEDFDYLRMTSIRGLRFVKLYNLRNSSISDCQDIQLASGSDLILSNNDSITLEGGISNSFIKDNRIIAAIPEYKYCSPGPTSYVSILGNQFLNNVQGLIIAESSTNTNISNNTFKRNFDTPLQFTGYTGRVCINRNKFIENFSLQGPGAISSIINPIYAVTNNLFVKNISGNGSGTMDIKLSGYYQGHPCLNQEYFSPSIMYNTFYGNQGEVSSAIKVKTLQDTANYYMLNNIFWDHADNLPSILIENGSAGNILIEKNILQHGSADITNLSTAAVSVNSICTTYPKFADTIIGNYWLTENSPAINFASDLLSIDQDIAGIPRPIGEDADIGAYEFSNPEPPQIQFSSRDTVLCTGDTILLSIQTQDSLYGYTWYRYFPPDFGDEYYKDRTDGGWYRVADGRQIPAYAYTHPQFYQKTYKVCVRNSSIEVCSEPIYIIKGDPVIDYMDNYQHINVCPQTDTIISFFYTSGLDTEFRWYSSTSGFLFEGNDTLPLTNIDTNHVISVNLTNACGSDSANIGRVELPAAPRITSESSTRELCLGNKANFHFTYEGGHDPVLSWYGLNHGSFDSDSRFLSNVSILSNDSIFGVVSDVCGRSDTTLVANVLIDYPPEITSNYELVNCCMHADTSLSIEFISDLPISTLYWMSESKGLLQDGGNILRLQNITENDQIMVRVDNSCGSVLDTLFEMHIVQPPKITTIFTDVARCENSDTLVPLDYLSDIAPNITWFGVQSGPLPDYSDTLFIRQAKNDEEYSVLITNDCGSDSAGILALTVIPLPVVDLGKDTAIYTGDSLLLDPGSEFIEYKWSTGSAEQSIYAEGNNTIWLEVSNENGCVNSDTLVISLIPTIGIDSKTDMDDQLLLYPNPATEVIYLEVPETISLPYMLSIYNDSGQLILNTEIPEQGIQQFEIIDSLSPGLYFISVSNAEFSSRVRFIVR